MHVIIQYILSVVHKPHQISRVGAVKHAEPSANLLCETLALQRCVKFKTV
jgi:hypothetical protein